ncbi:vestitone reductase-like [Cynara cardunculus var. scolymus]|uniref:vestitone reductase-like n=1 Tax=Cynara cardunculus var. scolymus TaxID=59895 RepID=UPI000D631472|nr:vestitone reductase-like [Cynara cardunculus var. scolymus]
MEKGLVCVTGGRGYLASWLIKTLLEDGYSVNATVRTDSGTMKDVSYLTNLPGASERLKIFDADLSKPETFKEPIKGCIGVFHVAHPIDFEGKEPEEVITERVVKGSLGILHACIDSKTVKKVVYTSSASAVVMNGKKHTEVLDEESWSDVDFIRSHFKEFGASYFISKTMVEKEMLEFGEKNGLDVVTVVPTYVLGPFIGPRCPDSVYVSMAMIFGDTSKYKMLTKTDFVHVDDVARAHIHLFEFRNANGRYICSKIGYTIEELYKFLSSRYPEYKMPNIEFLKDAETMKLPSVSSSKLLGTGFRFQYGLKEMFDDAINCCKRNKIL